jgi:DNA/RNA-binding domain of Phe-tRNA-synthetase-like protein
MDADGHRASCHAFQDCVIVIRVDPHPLLEVAAFTTTFPRALCEMSSPPWLSELLSPAATSPLTKSEELRGAIRDVLRHAGYKPTGRGKPASEYLVRAAEENALRSINAAVDVCNLTSLHSGIPISVIDLDLGMEPFRIGPGEASSRYVFNASGQEIDVEGLLCLHDASGPCANAVKDAQRTKTSGATTRTLSIYWGARAFPGAAARAAAWSRELLGKLGATTAEVKIS